jgi:hypothetical protein
MIALNLFYRGLTVNEAEFFRETLHSDGNWTGPEQLSLVCAPLRKPDYRQAVCLKCPDTGVELLVGSSGLIIAELMRILGIKKIETKTIYYKPIWPAQIQSLAD